MAHNKTEPLAQTARQKQTVSEDSKARKCIMWFLKVRIAQSCPPQARSTAPTSP